MSRLVCIPESETVFREYILRFRDLTVKTWSAHFSLVAGFLAVSREGQFFEQLYERIFYSMLNMHGILLAGRFKIKDNCKYVYLAGL